MIVARGQITIWNYKDGDDAYSVNLDHDTHAVACDANGNALSGELGQAGKAVFALSAYRGAVKLAMRYSSAASTKGICAWKFGAVQGCTAAQMQGSNEKFCINAITADSAYVEIICSVDGTTSVVKRVSVVKQKKGEQGAQGVPGTPGTNGHDGKPGWVIRPRGEWLMNTQYHCDLTYHDVVLYDGSVYICKNTHNSGSQFNSSQWGPFNEFQNVATDVLLANRGYIKVLGAGQMQLGDNPSSQWLMTNGSIRHTGTGLELTKDGRLSCPNGLSFSVGGKNFDAVQQDNKNYADSKFDNLQVGGRNLLQLSTAVPGYLSPTNGTEEGSGDASSWDQRFDYIPVKPNEQLTLSLYNNIDGKPDYVLGRFWIYNANKVAIKQELPYGIGWITPQSATFTMPSDAAFVRCSLICGNWDGYWKLERGNKATDWTPAPEDTAAKIEANTSEIKQLPDSITLSVSKKITGGALNYVSGTQESWSQGGMGVPNQCISPNDRWVIHKEMSGKQIGAAFKIKFEGCTFNNASCIMQSGYGNGWSWFCFTDSHPVSENKEYEFFLNDCGKPIVSGDVTIYVRVDNVSGGMITVSDVRVYDAPYDEKGNLIQEPLPWYPSRWDTGVLESKITQTAEQISLKVERQVGGENLLYNSSLSSDLIGWGVNGGSANMTAQIVNKDKTVDWLQGYPCLELWFNAAFKGIYRYFLLPDIEGEGDVFTVSFDMLKRNPWPYQLCIGIEDSPQKAVDITNHPINEWKRVTVVQKVSRVGSQAILIYGGEGDGGVVYIKNMKVERGSVATPWYPAPSEQHDKLLATGIDVMNEKIVLTANNTVIQSNSGQQIAMFTVDNKGRPWIKGENIDAKNLKIGKLEASSPDLPLGLYANADNATLYITGITNLSGTSQNKVLRMEMGGFNDLAKDKNVGGYLQVRGYRKNYHGALVPQFMRIDNKALTYISKDNNRYSQLTDSGLFLDGRDASRAIYLGSSLTQVKYGGQWYNGYTGTLSGGLRVVGGIICESSPTTANVPNINDSDFEIDY